MSVQTSIHVLKNRKGVWVNSVTNTVTVVKGNHSVGIGMWKHIDYLVNHCGFTVAYK